jgi:hypothetical protein
VTFLHSIRLPQAARAATLLAFAFACVPACEANDPQRQPIAAPLRPREPERTRAPAASTPLATRPELAAELSAPAGAVWSTGSAGAVARHVRITLTNLGDVATRVADLRVSFHAQRQGVAFPCAPHVGGSVKDPEPSELAPGQKFTYERDLDCAFAATGRYDVAAFVRFGDGDGAHDDPIGTFGFEVTGVAPYAPRPLEGRPALHVALTGSTEPRDRPPEAWKHGDYHLTLLVVNTGAEPQTLGASRVLLAVTSKGSPVAACPKDVMLARIGPLAVAPGHAETVPLPLKCPLAPRGEYEVSARLAADADKTDGPEVARIHLHVKSEDEPPLTPTPGGT